MRNANPKAGISFAPAKFNLSGDAYAVLADSWQSASTHDIFAITILVAGDHDNANADEDLLGQRRANAVKTALINLDAPADLIAIEVRQSSPKKTQLKSYLSCADFENQKWT